MIELGAYIVKNVESRLCIATVLIDSWKRKPSLAILAILNRIWTFVKFFWRSYLVTITVVLLPLHFFKERNLWRFFTLRRIIHRGCKVQRMTQTYCLIRKSFRSLLIKTFEWATIGRLLWKTAGWLQLRLGVIRVVNAVCKPETIAQIFSIQHRQGGAKFFKCFHF